MSLVGRFKHVQAFDVRALLQGHVAERCRRRHIDSGTSGDKLSIVEIVVIVVAVDCKPTIIECICPRQTRYPANVSCRAVRVVFSFKGFSFVVHLVVALSLFDLPVCLCLIPAHLLHRCCSFFSTYFHLQPDAVLLQSVCILGDWS